MSGRQFAETLLAVVGIWYIAGALPMVPLTFGLVVGNTEDAETLERLQLAAVATHTVVQLSVGVVLLVWRSSIAARLLSPSEPEPVHTSSSFQAAAFAVLGAYFFVRGVSGTLPFIMVNGFGGEPTWELISEDVLYAALGAALFCGARGLSNGWHRLRSAGRGAGAA